MDAVDRFADAVRAFQNWLLGGSDEGPDAARTALQHLLNLYGRALDLPSPSANADEPEAPSVSDEEWRKAFAGAGRLPLDLYETIFNPAAVDPQEPVKGSISDDLADIYRDLAAGLRAYNAGHRSSAIWEWGFNLHTHWGAHATSAIHALHWWITENCPHKLSSQSEERVG